MYTNNVLAPRLQHTNIITYADGALFSTLSAEKFNLGIYNTDSNYSLAISGNSLFYHNVTISGTLSANNVYFTSITSVQISISSQELNFLGSVSITGDEVIPIAQHLFQVYKPSNTTIPIFYISSAGLIGIDTKFPTSKLSISGDIDLSGNYKYYGITGISSPNYNNNLSQITTSGGIVTGITNISISSITAGIDFSAYTTTALFVSTTSLLNTNINSLSSYVGNLERFTTTGLFLTITSNLSNAINSNSAAIISLSSSLSTLSSNFISISSNIGNLNRFTLTSDYITVTSNFNSLINSLSTNQNQISGSVTSLSSQFIASTAYLLSISSAAVWSRTGTNSWLTNLGDNVGIGTFNPTQKLSISGNISTTGNITSSTATNIGLFVLTSGRVGVNQSAPAVALEISGSLICGRSFSLGKGSPTASLGYAFNRDFNTGSIYDSSRYAFQFTRPSNADRLDLEVYNGAGTLISSRTITVDSLGFVGIGTTGPSTKLHVLGNVTISGTTVSISANTTVTGNFISTTAVGLGLHSISTGNIGIGTATPTQKLSISGNSSISGGIIYNQQTNHSITSNLLQNTQNITYQMGSNYVIAFNDAGTIKYRYLVLTGTDAVWNYSTIAP